MKQTPARTQFKRHLGQANHYLITTLVALNTLDASPVVNAPSELRTSWNPKDKNGSLARSRVFILHSFLGWAVDSLDMYVTLLNRKPKFLQNAKLSSEMDGCGRSVLKKIKLLGEYYKICPTTIALVDVLVTWRNNVFHELADNKIHPDCVKAMREGEEQIREYYRGLDITALPEKAQKGADLTFKETASLINAAHKYVEEVDMAVIKTHNVAAMCTSIISDALSEKTRFPAKYLSLSGEQRVRFVKNWLANKHGLSDISSDVLRLCTGLSRPKAEEKNSCAGKG